MPDDDLPTISDVSRVIRRLRMAGDYAVARSDEEEASVVKVVPAAGPVEESKTVMLKRALAGQGITIGPDEDDGVIPVTGFRPSRPVGVGFRPDQPQGPVEVNPLRRG